MFRNTLTQKSPSNLTKRDTPVAVLAASIVLVRCGGSAEADITSEGRLAYACTLTDHVLEEHGDPDSLGAFMGHEADPGARETATVGMLANGSDNETFAAIGSTLVESVQLFNPEELTSGLYDIQAACEDSGISKTADVSHQGQLDYACTLTHHFRQEHGLAAEWIDERAQAGWSGFVELASAAALVGAANGQILAEYPELSEAGIDLLNALQRRDLEVIDNSVEAFDSACAEL